MIIIEISIQKSNKASLVKYKILSACNVPPLVMQKIIDIFSSISDDIASIAVDVFEGRKNHVDYFVIEFPDASHFASYPGSNIQFSFIFSHTDNNLIIKVDHY